MTTKFNDLKVFQESHKLVLLIYKLTESFPKSEIFGLTSQLRRASSSIVANMVEGNARSHKNEFLQFLNIANGSLEEVRYFLLLANDLAYLTESEYNTCVDQTEKVGKLLFGLRGYVKNKKS